MNHHLLQEMNAFNFSLLELDSNSNSTCRQPRDLLVGLTLGGLAWYGHNLLYTNAAPSEE